MAAPGTDITRPVTLLHLDVNEARFPLAVDPLGQPRRIDAPTPPSAYIKACKRNLLHEGYTTNESAGAEQFEFENARLAKKLDIFVWTVKRVYDGTSRAFP